MDEEWIKEIHELSIFSRKAREICTEYDKEYEFECPVCGGKAYAEKWSKGKRLSASCSKCELAFVG